MASTILSPQNPTFEEGPHVELVNAFAQPFNNAVATARTCYASRIITAADVDKDDRSRAQRDAIAKSTYDAGHHTTLQHATFQFALSRVSRQLLWSFLHAHPFYNSEQVSQRYVTVRRESVYVPPSVTGPMQSIYRDAIAVQTRAYHELAELLFEPAQEAFFAIFPARRKAPAQWRSAIVKRAQEAARYVLPIATHAHLYHTVSGLTLHRYRRTCEAIDVCDEARLLVARMVAAVDAHDPLFFKEAEDPIPLEETHEFLALAQSARSSSSASSEARAFCDGFDAQLGGKLAVLSDWGHRAEETLGEAVRAVMGVDQLQLSDAAALELVLSPAKNPQLSGALNVAAHGKLSRALTHVHYTFQKKLSHAADSQDQRHRLTPGTRPHLHRHFVSGRPDVILPSLIEQDARARDLCARVFSSTWKAIDTLIDGGVAPPDAMYLLPNATTVRFHASGSLLGWHHKWTARLCYNAQEEIWRASLDEVAAVEAVHPRIARYILPPCGLRHLAKTRPICPEGARFCGVPVWKLPREAYVRSI